MPEPEPSMDHVETQSHAETHDHPGYGTYVVIAVILTIITALEVAVFYIPALASALVPILVTLSAGKFILVVMFYMHLRMDHRLFTSVFVAPLLLAMFLVVAMIVLFRVLPAYA
jgi:cytochrome c oxidase subunit 4